MTRVALCRSKLNTYPAESPFHPPAVFPETARLMHRLDASNQVYPAMRQMLALLRLDEQHFGSPEWNPLGAYIRPGDKVVIKPNLVLHEFGLQKNAYCLTTHGSVIRAVLDYVYLAAGPNGRIIIADAPLQGADFDRVLADTGIPEIVKFYRDEFACDIQVLDLRQVRAIIDENSSLIRRIEALPGDPQGYCEIDLGTASQLQELDAAYPRYVVGDYDAAVTNVRHRGPRHSYTVSRTVLDADVVICVPKLKTHSKTGLTVCLKNIVGIIGSKDCLPHHRHGRNGAHGDEFAQDYPAYWRLSARVHDALQGRVPVPLWRMMRWGAHTVLGAGTAQHARTQDSDFYPSGGWHGNDTIWRTVDDLNRILFFCDPMRAALQAQEQRRYFALADGIVAMEGNGPLRGIPKPASVLLGGDDPLAIDVVAATLMGFDWRQVRLLQGIAQQACPYSRCGPDASAIALLSNVPEWDSLQRLARHNLAFHAPNGWRGHVEMRDVA